jgi:hypothetical protein
LKGEVTEVVLGAVTALITVKVGDSLNRIGITKHSAPGSPLNAESASRRR